jgi:glycosyltransferase involved in cell wall biosynthesis
METSSPLISIITVVYNCVNTLEETILSVINQDFDNFEYIIIDGGSTDGTIEIINKYQDKIAKFISEPDNGIYDAMNKGLSHSNGQWVNFMNAGDLFYKKNILTNIFTAENLNFDMIYGNVCFFDENQCFILNTKSNKYKINLNAINHQSVFIKKNIHNPFSSEYKISADHNLIYKIVKFNNCKHINIIVCKFLIGGLSANSRLIRNERFFISLKNGNIIDSLLAVFIYLYATFKILFKFLFINLLTPQSYRKIIDIKNRLEGNSYV